MQYARYFFDTLFGGQSNWIIIMFIDCGIAFRGIKQRPASWLNGRASVFETEGCGFEPRRGHLFCLPKQQSTCSRHSKVVSASSWTLLYRSLDQIRVELCFGFQVPRPDFGIVSFLNAYTIRVCICAAPTQAISLTGALHRWTSRRLPLLWNWHGWIQNRNSIFNVRPGATATAHRLGPARW